MHKTQTAILENPREVLELRCPICRLAERTPSEDDFLEESDGWAGLCGTHRHEAKRLLERGEPGVDRANAPLIYRKVYEARRGGRPKRFGELACFVSEPR